MIGDVRCSECLAAAQENLQGRAVPEQRRSRDCVLVPEQQQGPRPTNKCIPLKDLVDILRDSLEPAGSMRLLPLFRMGQNLPVARQNPQSLQDWHSVHTGTCALMMVAGWLEARKCAGQ